MRLGRWCDDGGTETAVGFTREHDDGFFCARTLALGENVVPSVVGEVADPRSTTAGAGRYVDGARREVSVSVAEQHVVLPVVAATRTTIWNDDGILIPVPREVSDVDIPDFRQRDRLPHGEVAPTVPEEDLDLVRRRALPGSGRRRRFDSHQEVGVSIVVEVCNADIVSRLARERIPGGRAEAAVTVAEHHPDAVVFVVDQHEVGHAGSRQVGDRCHRAPGRQRRLRGVWHEREVGAGTGQARHGRNPYQ